MGWLREPRSLPAEGRDFGQLRRRVVQTPGARQPGKEH